MRTTVLAAFAVLSYLSSNVAGESNQTRPTFEAASLKPTAPNEEHSWSTNGIKGGPGTDNPGRFTATNMTLRSLLTSAYGLQSDQVLGSGLDAASFDIVATVPKGSTREQMNQMLAALLEERFRLHTHWELREARVYVLSVGRNGAKIKAHQTAPASTGATGEKTGSAGSPRQAPSVYVGYLPNGQTRFVFTAAPISKLVDLIARWTKRTTVDETGLRERYDFSLDYTQDGDGRSPGDEVGGPSLSTAVKEIGLKLETRKSEVKYLVVDHFEKTPVSN